MEKGISLPDTQLEAMQVTWDKDGTIMFSELSEGLENKGREWKPNTVLTLLSRLAERGMITICKRDRLNEYTVQVTRGEYRQKQARILTKRVFGGDARHLTSVLAEQDYLIKENYDELEAF